ncbi:hypothetical protein ZEAMMB73_Zm00001d048747 [Zea mays]|uniref:Uncharacterized protein n=1 Tax=Zea mays TaxID=4577 RepID=A0A1D6PPW0_MAIZE|nr:hypothetical protein ZEAMMB73_Zm00001d048747 [Zea mays]
MGKTAQAAAAHAALFCFILLLALRVDGRTAYSWWLFDIHFQLAVYKWSLDSLVAKKSVGVLLPKSAIKFERYLMDEILSIDADVSEVEFGKKTCFVPRQRLPKFDLHLQVAATKKGGRCGGDAGAQPPGMYGIDLGTIVGLELDVDIVVANATTKKLQTPKQNL